MENSKQVLKKAFIDSEINDIINTTSHTFSPQFEDAMQKMIKSQKGIFKLLNTASKRIACIFLTILLIITFTVFGVKALREPVIDTMQSFFVNIREMLAGTQAENIAVHFTDDINEIRMVNYVTSTPVEYIINDAEKIEKFTSLLTDITWNAPKTEYDTTTGYIFWTFEFMNEQKIVCKINMCGVVTGSFGTVEIISEGRTASYNIPEQAYYDILSFTTRKYYLHKSDLELPTEEFCLAEQEKIFAGLSEEEKAYISEQIRNVHYTIETMLLQKVSILKEPDSSYWFPAITGESFTDPISGVEYYNGEENSFNGVLKTINNIIRVIKDEESKKSFSVIYNDLKTACECHDIGSIFTVHEYIHDYDYFAINYPPHYQFEPADWGGLDDYFGHLS